MTISAGFESPVKLTPIRKGQKYLREVQGHGGGVIKATAPFDGFIVHSTGFIGALALMLTAYRDHGGDAANAKAMPKATKKAKRK